MSSSRTAGALLRAPDAQTAPAGPQLFLPEMIGLDYVETEPELTVLFYGIGQDSTAIAYKLVYDAAFRKRYAPHRLLVIASDTGCEHDFTYAYLEHMKRFFRLHGIEFHFLTPDLGWHSQAWQSLDGQWERNRTVGLKAGVKSCSHQLKVVPAYRFLDAWVARTYDLPFKNKEALKRFAARRGRIRSIIGLAKGEEHRVENPASVKEKWRQVAISTVYPLIEIGYDRRACQEYIRSLGQPVPWPSNCMKCMFTSELELLWLYRRHPLVFADWARQEQAKLAKFAHKGEKNFTVWGRKTLGEVLSDAQMKYGHWTDAMLDEYKMSHGHCINTRY